MTMSETDWNITWVDVVFTILAFAALIAAGIYGITR